MVCEDSSFIGTPNNGYLKAPPTDDDIDLFISEAEVDGMVDDSVYFITDDEADDVYDDNSYVDDTYDEDDYYFSEVEDSDVDYEDAYISETDISDNTTDEESPPAQRDKSQPSAPSQAESRSAPTNG